MQRKNRKESGIKNQESRMKFQIGIVVSEYNSDITFPMRDGAIETLKNAGIPEKNIEVVYAPGSFEIPILCQKLINEKEVDGVIAIGCVIKGDTDHYHFIAQESTRGIMDVMLKTNIPITNAILTVNNLKQAKLRSTGKMNKGMEAAEALIKLLGASYKL